MAITNEEIPEALKPFLNHTDKLNMQEGIICGSCRLVIPRELQSLVLKELHNVHHGLTATLAKAHETVYWPDMSKIITNLVPTVMQQLC